MIVDATPVLSAPIVPLPVEGGGIHPVEQNSQQLLVGDQLRVEEHLDGLGMTGVSVADVFVSWVLLGSGSVSHHAAHHTRHPLEGELDSPETSCSGQSLQSENL